MRDRKIEMKIVKAKLTLIGRIHGKYFSVIYLSVLKIGYLECSYAILFL